MKLIRLGPSDVTVGTLLPFHLYDRNHILLISSGHVIANESLLKRTLERGIYVDEDQVKAASKLADSQLKQRPGPIPTFTPTSASVFDLVRGVRSDLATLLLEHTSRTHFQRAVMDVADEIQDICRTDSDTSIASIVLDRTALYPIRHSVNTAILTELTMRHIEQNPAHRLSAVAAALTMNIGMLQLQEILYYQSEPLDAEQKAAITAHPTAGVEQLHARGITNEIWLRAVVQHHEQLDGKGYPKGLVNAQLAREGHMITIVERYCSMISERGYRNGMLPKAVLKKLFLQSDSLNPLFVELLVKEVGIYPPGSYVRLMNDELAIVLKRTDRAHQPLVRSLTGSEDGADIEGSIRDTRAPSLHVATAVDPREIEVAHDATHLCTSSLRQAPEVFDKMRELRAASHTVLDKTLRPSK